METDATAENAARSFTERSQSTSSTTPSGEPQARSSAASTEKPSLARAGGKSLSLRWQPPAGYSAIEVEHRRAAWFVSAAWSAWRVPEDRLQTDSAAGGGEEVVEVKLEEELVPLTAYDVRMAAILADGSRHTSGAATFRTAPAAPAMPAAPTVKWARHDRLMLEWEQPSTQLDEVVSYRIRYYDCDPRWPVKHEVDVLPSSASAESASEHAGDGGSGTGVQARCYPAEAEGHLSYMLCGLAAANMYYAQITAVTSEGVGQWSPRSSALYTWRVAPAFQAPRLLCRTHGSVIVGLNLEALEKDTVGIDEEPDKLEISLSILPKEKDAEIFTVSRQEAETLAQKLRELSGAGEEEDGPAPTYAAALPRLKPNESYACRARAVTLAGVGEMSPMIIVDTIPVPPDVCDLRVDTVRHDAASVSWCVKDECASSAAIRASHEEEVAEALLAARRLRGFRVRITDERQKDWTEILGVRIPGRSSGSSAAPPERLSLELERLQPHSRTFVQVSAVAQEEGAGNWCEAAEVVTERLAPSLVAMPAEVVSVGRCGATLAWPTPEALRDDAAIIAYSAYICKDGRSREEQETSLALVASREAADALDGPCVWLDNSITRARLGSLEPGTTYAIRLAARTSRGVGEKSVECTLLTRPPGPEMGRNGEAPRCVEAFYNKLHLRCSGPVADWQPEEEVSDVKQYRARYYECARFGPHGAWVQAEVEFSERPDEDAVDFWLLGLQPDRQYVVQVAAVTDAGQGPWSKQSPPVSTWRVAPAVATPRVVLRTQSVCAVGWTLEPREDDARQAKLHEEGVLSFNVTMTIPGSSRADAVAVLVDRSEAERLAGVWQSNRTAVSDAVAAAAAKWPASATLLLDPGEPQAGALYVAAIHGLAANQSYVCSVSALTAAGEGKSSSPSAEVRTLPLAPLVEGLQIDEALRDELRLSCRHLVPPCDLPDDVVRALDMERALDDLKVRGYSARCAEKASWTRLNWKEPLYVDVGSETRNRIALALSGLETEQPYVIEARTHSHGGVGEWRRLETSDKASFTAILSPPPPAPEMVYALPRSLTFSFAGSGDKRVVAYEVRAFELSPAAAAVAAAAAAGSHEFDASLWQSPPKPLEFDGQSPAVRITSELRWIVHIDNLRADTAYVLRLRGVTQAGTGTEWSAASEVMTTLSASEAGGDDRGAAPTDAADTSPSVASGAVLANPPAHAIVKKAGADSADAARVDAGGGAKSVDEFSKKLDAVLSFTLDYATAGVRLPSIRVPSVAEQATELLQQHKGSVAAAVKAAAQLRDEEASWQSKLPDFLIQQVPVVGCSTLLLRELWRSIRRVALIAHLYGHNVRAADTQALILTCLVPTGCGGIFVSTAPTGQATAGQGTAAAAVDLEDIAASSRRVVLLVARALAKETFEKAPQELKVPVASASLTSLLEVTGRILGAAASNAVERSTEALSVSTALATPASKDDASLPGKQRSATSACAGELENLATAAAADAMQTTPERVALVVFRPEHMAERPLVVLGFLALWLLPLLIAFAHGFGQFIVGLHSGLVVLLASQTVAALGWIWMRFHFDSIVESIPATFVFVVYNSIVGIASAMAMWSLLQTLREDRFLLLLSLYNLSSCYLRWAEDLSDDAELEGTQQPAVARARNSVRLARMVLWVALLCTYVVDALLGCGLGIRSLRLLHNAEPSDLDASNSRYLLTYASELLAAWAQGRLLELLQRRTVLLRMLGARKAIFAGLSLLLMGAFAVVQQAKTLTFLRRATPSTWWCTVVMWLRRFGAVAGFCVPVAFALLQWLHHKCGLPRDLVVAAALGLGASSGHLVSASFTVVQARQDDRRDADCGVLLLFPHMSAQARARAGEAMRLASRRLSNTPVPDTADILGDGGGPLAGVRALTAQLWRPLSWASELMN
eukprot:TRINITY_DN46590_c0_g1_i1.p1 TRINITY_DN46590_c0_g1~~TRINITY_DN46590_c0_g1_i1.p1  ORF type:complete len:1903 (+),score=416.66 TRINITY_DN46590_c0_g1_i1:129-5837(+)